MNEWACAFMLVEPKDPHGQRAVQLIELDNDSIRAVPVTRLEFDRSGRGGWGTEYPRTVALDDVLHLHNPRVIESEAYFLRIVYDAVCRGQSGSALVEVVYPGRLRWPGLGRLIEFSIDKRAATGT